MNEPCDICRCEQFREIGTLGTRYWVRCVGCGAMIARDPQPRTEECPRCSEVVDASEYNGGRFQFECPDCGEVWQH